MHIHTHTSIHITCTHSHPPRGLAESATLEWSATAQATYGYVHVHAYCVCACCVRVCVWFRVCEQCSFIDIWRQRRRQERRYRVYERFVEVRSRVCVCVYCVCWCLCMRGCHSMLCALRICSVLNLNNAHARTGTTRTTANSRGWRDVR